MGLHRGAEPWKTGGFGVGKSKTKKKKLVGDEGKKSVCRG